MNKLDTFLLATATVVGLTGCKTAKDCQEDWARISDDMETEMAKTDDCDEAGKIGAKAAGKYSGLLESCSRVTEGHGISVILFTSEVHDSVAKKCGWMTSEETARSSESK